MPVKKKSGVKTRKKGAKKANEYLPYVNDVPQPQDPEVIYPKAEIWLTYADGVGDYFGRPQFNQFRRCLSVSTRKLRCWSATSKKCTWGRSEMS